MNEVKIICDRWLFKANQNNLLDLYNLNVLYNYFQDVDFFPFIKAFTDRLSTINHTFTRSEQVSGSICFFGAVFTSLLNFGHVAEIDDLFTFALGYMLIDHHLDDKNVSLQEKEKSVGDIYNFLNNGILSNNVLISNIANRYLKLIERKPNSRIYFLNLFNKEVECYKIEKSKTIYDQHIYQKITEEKGGYTSLCIASLIGLSDNNKSSLIGLSDNIELLNQNNSNYSLGSCIQYVDDLLDIDDDRENGIYTLACYDAERSNWDNYIYRLVNKINDLSPTYNFFKIILLFGIILAVHDHPNYVSSELYELLQNYDIFGSSSKEKLIIWFHNKLYGYIGKT